jgi:hypothetical protein
MRIAVFGGAYSNPYALSAMLRDARDDRFAQPMYDHTGASTSAEFRALVGLGAVSPAEAKRLVVERFLVLRLEDGTLPAAFRCAV